MKNWLNFIIIGFLVFPLGCTCSVNQKRVLNLRSIASQNKFISAYSELEDQDIWSVVKSDFIDLNGDKEDEILVIFQNEKSTKIHIVTFQSEEQEHYIVLGVRKIEVTSTEENPQSIEFIETIAQDVTLDEHNELIIHYRNMHGEKLTQEKKMILKSESLIEIWHEEVLYKSDSEVRKSKFEIIVKNKKAILTLVTETSKEDIKTESARNFMWFPQTGRFEEVMTKRMPK